MKPRTGFVPSITAAPPAPPPLHHCAGQRKGRSPACGLQAATSSSSEPRRYAVKLRHGSISPAIAVPPAPTFALSALPRVLPAACAVSIKPLTASAATLGGRSPFALRGPPPLTCGEADGYDAGSCQPARSRPCHLLHCASIRRLSPHAGRRTAPCAADTRRPRPDGTAPIAGIIRSKLFGGIADGND